MEDRVTTCPGCRYIRGEPVGPHDWDPDKLCEHCKYVYSLLTKLAHKVRILPKETK